ncbi:MULTISPECIES: glycosyltransferase family 2 protein [Streptomyces]|uniref:Glycosyltransferase involved in cell wall biosynthesis n=2 Tax=Streptomyces TaxID=1883 RepID=A0AA40SHH2_9ACTN|nr:glycosyltransferase family 2 protein [Streptomyces calvus]MBA8946604.1 glycosyltransferase involved in cell wall biosynthesis [Streptomyces calvus]MBA8974351.1 glycosyltransferase involved in cell wall biosynthesis [Streptomyces calvus]MYS27778.1 glycosyltransferase [Streptomyces sp. SID7804]GGP65685.1 glycosyl transferase [Streptomyces calvus]
MPKLSVVVPMHNVEAFAESTLRSLAGNADPDFEFLLVDDCSTDATSWVIDRWAEKHPGVRVIRHEKNMGIAQARNSGIDAAEGEFITFLDGDDWYGPGHLAELVSAIEELGCDFARTDHVQVTGTERVVRRPPAPLRGAVMDPRDGIAPADMETMVDYPFVWAGIYRRHLFADGGMRFATELRTAEDRLWIWRLHLKARTYASLGLHGVFYRRGVATSLTQIKDSRQLDFIPAYDALLRDVQEDPETDRFLLKAVRTYCAMIAFHIGKAHEYESSAAQRLRREARDALHRMPQHALEETLKTIDSTRSRLLSRLRDGRKAA